MKTRLLTKRERQVIVTALIRAAAETRKARSAALMDALDTKLVRSAEYINELAVLSQTQERLAAEIAELGEGDVELKAVMS